MRRKCVSDVCFFLPHDLMLMKTLSGIVHCDFSCVILSLCIDMHVHKCEEGGGGSVDNLVSLLHRLHL